jgi:hypothetical protein
VKVPLPGQEGLPGHPPWDVTQYVCGEDESFVSDLIMYGRYRAQDDAFARSLGYITGKWPLLPYEGSAVSQRPHDIFETYEEIYQFRSPGAAAMWLGNLRGPSSRDDLAGLQLPAAFIARTEVMGPDNGRDEHSIDVSGERGDEVLFVTFRGGLLLSWHDVSRPWSSAYALISKASAG